MNLLKRKRRRKIKRRTIKVVIGNRLVAVRPMALQQGLEFLQRCTQIQDDLNLNGAPFAPEHLDTLLKKAPGEFVNLFSLLVTKDEQWLQEQGCTPVEALEALPELIALNELPLLFENARILKLLPQLRQAQNNG